MTINHKKNHKNNIPLCKFEEVITGEMFVIDKRYYIKLDKEYNGYNSVELIFGTPAWFDGDQIVECHSYKLTVN